MRNNLNRGKQKNLEVSMKTKAIPKDFHSFTPDLVVRDAAEAIEFYKRR